MLRFFAGMALGVVSTGLVLGTEPDRNEFGTLAERYHQILVKRPSRGATFDLWYRHYLDAGRLEELFRRVEDGAGRKPDDYAAQMLLGLVEERRGRDDQAVQAYEHAQRIEPKRFEPPFLRGLLLARLSRIDEAAGALNEAMRLDPPRGEFLEMARRLGQIQLRQGKSRDAIATWSRLIERFPNDRHVLAELAELLTDEAQYDEAIQRWEQVIAASGEDRHARLSAQVAIAQLQLRKGNPETSLKLFDQALGQVDPESWQARDIQRRIETLFQQRNDPAGLVDYYRKRLKDRPDDLSGRILLAGALRKANRGDEAIKEYRAVIKSAPGRRDLREALIEELTRVGNRAEALAEARTLAEAYPREVEVLKRLGRLILSAATEEKRRDAEEEASRVWSRIGAIRPDDPDLALQVAELCRQAALAARSEAREGAEAGQVLFETAEASYREAIRRAPGASSYREYLGEFLHSRGRGDEALAVWKAMAEPPRDSAENLRELADVLERFGFLKDAIASGEQALLKNPDNLDGRMRQARLLIKAREFDQAIALLDQLDRLAESPAQVEKALLLRVDALAGAGKVEPEVARLRKATGNEDRDLRDLWLLGLLLTKIGRDAEAARVFDRAAGDPRADARLLQAAAEAHEQARDRLGALRIYRRLVERDPKGAVAHYEKIAALELEVGGITAAKEAAEALIRRAPADLDGYRLRAEIAFRLNDVEDGLQTLLRAVRVAPREPSIRAQLAAALARAGRVAEANEHYWRAFEIAGDLSEKLSAIAALAELAVATQGQDRLLNQLRRLQRGQGDPKTATLCLVEALKIFRDLPAARQELEKLASTRPDDSDVLRLLATMAEDQRDWKAAAGYQERLVAITPDRAGLETLLSYYQRTGDRARAGNVLLRLLEFSHDPAAFIAAVERELKQRAFREALALAEPGRAKWPDAWPLHFQAGVAYLALGESEKAERCFKAVLDQPEGLFPYTNVPASTATAGSSQTPLSRQPAQLMPSAQLMSQFLAAAPNFPNPGSTPLIQGPLGDFPPGDLPELDDLRLAADAWESFQAIASATPERNRPQAAAQSSQVTMQLNRIQRDMVNMQRLIQTELGQYQNQASLPDPARQRVAFLQNRLNQMKQQHQSLLRQRNAPKVIDPFAIPADEHAARLLSLVGPAVAHGRGGATEATWLARLRKEAETSPDRARDLVLVFMALDRRLDAFESNERLIQIRPDDPFPHVARLFLIDSFKKGQPSEPLSWLLLDEKDRSLRKQAALDSFAWLAAHRPQVRFELARQVGRFLYHNLGDPQTVERIVAPMIPSADRIDDLVSLSEVAASTPEVSLQRDVLARARELAAEPGDPSSTLNALRRLIESTAPVVRDEGWLNELLALLDACLKIRLPEGVDPSAAPVSNASTTPGLLPPPFPRPGPLLDGLRLDILQRIFTRFAAANRSEMLARHLEREAKTGDESRRPAYLLARVALEWWTGKPKRALELLEQIEGEAHDDGGIGLALVQGHLATGDVPGAVHVLDRIRPSAAPLAAEADQLRGEISTQLLGGSPESQIQALLLALGNQTRPPELKYLFEDSSSILASRRMTTAQLRTVQAQYQAQLRTVQVAGNTPAPVAPTPTAPVAPTPTAPVAPAPTAAFPPTQVVINNLRVAVPNPTMPGQPINTNLTTRAIPLNVRRLLELARAQARLDEIERAASAQWEKHPADSRLGVLVALARFTRSDIAGASTAAERWSTLLKQSPEIGGEPEAAWIASRCMIAPETRALGRRIGREVVATARVRNFQLPHRALLVQLLQASVEDGEKEEALEELQLLKGLTGFNQGTLY
jgi:tetratricopeptide (TPR) repeat protein